MMQTMMYHRFISCFVLLALLISTACSTRERQGSAVVNQNNDVVLARKIDLQLISAAVRDNADEIDTSIKAGANVNAVIERLGPPLVIVTLNGNYRGAELLLENGANVSAADSDGYTPIITAAIFNRRDIAKLLLSKGADVNAEAHVTVKGSGTGAFTPLLIAKAKGYQDMVKLLTEAGAKE